MLPLAYVKRIHQLLAVRYGSMWESKWAGIDQRAVQLDWAEQLDGMTLASIKKAIASLPDEYPPTCTAFRALGVIREEHRPPPPMLPAPANREAGDRFRAWWDAFRNQHQWRSP